MKIKHLDDLFAYARERYKIFLRRKEGEDPPWTQDKVMQTNRFCNIFREDDRTTQWFRENIREPLKDDDKIFFATIIFRWFNRIETGELLKDLILGDWDREEASRRIKGVAPVVTGAYIINTPPGFKKGEGVLELISNVEPDWEHLAARIEIGNTGLEDVWRVLTEYPRLGNFTAYEIVTDLRFTHLLDKAPDIMTWASPGPGCARGLDRLLGNEVGGFNYYSENSRAEMMTWMRQILQVSRSRVYWPSHWPSWEMREVEHLMCEFDKYLRVRDEGGRMKQSFKPKV